MASCSQTGMLSRGVGPDTNGEQRENAKQRELQHEFGQCSQSNPRCDRQSGHRVIEVSSAEMRLRRPQTLSASVEVARAAPLAAPHPHRLISGMSSPCWRMYCLCSISLSRMACLA